MTDQEKALDYSMQVSMYNRPTNGEYDTATYKAFLAGCEWKDKQFKEFFKSYKGCRLYQLLIWIETLKTNFSRKIKL